MNQATAEQLIYSYVEGWKRGDANQILGSLAPECIIVESHGPTYRGVAMVRRWIDTWFASANTVDRWDITSVLTISETSAFEWVFECTIAGTQRRFEGASVVRFQDDKIGSLREYRMTGAPYEWDQ